MQKYQGVVNDTTASGRFSSWCLISLIVEASTSLRFKQANHLLIYLSDVFLNKQQLVIETYPNS